jgi:cytochrome c oxidase subunit II
MDAGAVAMIVFAALTALTPSSIRLGKAEAGRPIITIHATRYQFEPSEITLKQGQRVTLRFVSHDVAHGVVVKKLSIDIDIEIARGHPKEGVVTPSEDGDFEGGCSRYCGTGHSTMRFLVHVTQ